MSKVNSPAQKHMERGIAVATMVTLISGAVIAYDFAQGAHIADFLNDQSDAHTIGVIFIGGLGCSLFGLLLLKLFPPLS